MHIEKCWKVDRVSGGQIVSGLVSIAGIVSHGSESTLQVSNFNQCIGDEFCQIAFT